MFRTGPALVLLLAATGADADPAALAARVLSLASTGDPERIEEALAAVPDALRSDPAWRAAAAGRVVARLVGAAQLREGAALSPDGAPALAAARVARETALGELRPLVREAPDDAEVLRALAVYYGAEGRPEETAKASALASAAGLTRDDWLDWAALVASTRGLPPAEAEPLLDDFLAGHPAIPAPWLSLARVRLAQGNRDGALAALDALLARVPDHRSAQALKQELLAPPPVAPVVPSVPGGPPPRTAPGYLPRKPVQPPAPRG
ncbi:MAG TPA: tetratricopeptide repeat protein [Anaeromyxobacteraceae bacterium]|nr:tetratricopeptide repeat protein [Anaeromyxobacteraceae bacterium]